MSKLGEIVLIGAAFTIAGAMRAWVAVAGLRYERAYPGEAPSFGMSRDARGRTLRVGRRTITNEAYAQMFGPTRSRPARGIP